MKKQLLFLLAFTAGASVVYAQSGNVGIGTTTPAAKLHVKASSGNNQYFRITAPNDTTRLTVTDIPTIIGSSTDLTLRPSDGSSGLTFYSTPVNLSFSTIRATKPLALESAGLLEIRSSTNRFAFANGTIHQARLYLGDFGLGLDFNTDTIQARMDVRTSATDSTNAFRLRNLAYDPLLTVLNNANTGIGTSAPAAKLHVAGNVRIADGTQGLNKIFSSDADGTGSWKTAAELGLGGGNSGWALEGNNLTGSEILGSTNAQPLRIVTDSTERIRVTETGNVGIGTSTPQTKLQIQNDAIGDNALAIGGVAPSIRLYGGDTLPSIGPATYDVPYAKIGLVTQTGQFANSAVPGDLVIQTVDTNKSIIFSNLFGGGNGTEQMRLNGKGYLGIGTSAPAVRTHILNPGTGGAGVFNANTANMALRLENNVNGNSVIQHFLAKDAAGATKEIIMGINPTYNGGNGAFYMGVNGNNSPGIQMDMVTGNVGIGIGPATNTIDVNGTARIRTVSQAPNTVTTVPLYKDANGVVVTAPAAANYGATTFGSSATIAPATTGTLLTIPASGGSMYKLLVRAINACGDQGVVEYFLNLGTTNNYFSIKPAGSNISSTVSTPTFIQANKSNVAVTWNNADVCVIGGGVTNLNYTINIVLSGANFLINVTNNGDATPAYQAVLTKMFD